MTHRIEPRVQETSTATGTGALAVGGATDKMRSFASAGFQDGDTFLGLIVNADAAEVELTKCTYNSAGGGSITRAATPRFSTTGAKIDFSAGDKTISLVELDGIPQGRLSIVTAGVTTVMADTDYEVLIKKTVSAAHAVTLPANPMVGQRARVTDGKGDLDVGANNITISASTTINGAASIVMQAAYQSLEFRWNGTEWNIL